MKKIIFITTLCLSLALMQEGKKSKNLKLMMKWKCYIKPAYTLNLDRLP